MRDPLTKFSASLLYRAATQARLAANRKLFSLESHAIQEERNFEASIRKYLPRFFCLWIGIPQTESEIRNTVRQRIGTEGHRLLQRIRDLDNLARLAQTANDLDPNASIWIQMEWFLELEGFLDPIEADSGDPIREEPPQSESVPTRV